MKRAFGVVVLAGLIALVGGLGYVTIMMNQDNGLSEACQIMGGTMDDLGNCLKFEYK